MPTLSFRPAHALARLLALLLPPRCPGCRAVGAAVLCPACHASLRTLPPHRCAVCLDPVVAPGRRRCAACLASRPAFARAFAAGRYDPPLSTAVRALKYRRQADAARALGALIAGAVPERVARRTDAVVPVPSHRERVAARGIDHAGLLAEAVAAALDRPVLLALQRPVATRTQVGRSASVRRANVEAAFRLLRPVAGLRLLLVDDVLTTGATAGACARLLCEGGARRVWLATAARAAGPVAGGAPPPYNGDLVVHEGETAWTSS